MASSDGHLRFLALALLLAVIAGLLEHGLSYERPKARHMIFVERPTATNGSNPQQVHVSLVGLDKMRVSWITDDEAPATIDYGTSPDRLDSSATGTTSSYKYLLYSSGQIHEAVIGPLKPDTVYYYRCSSDPSRSFSLKTPPAQLPIKFAVIGDLGQTDWTQSTLQHISTSGYDMLLLPGDLSYADMLQPLWDSFGRLVEPLASQRPWMVTQGNHEIEKIAVIHSEAFTSYNARWPMPYEESGSSSNLYYSFEVAGAHIIMLGSYTDFGLDSDQYKWLEQDLSKVDRGKTPWIVVLLHAPWYNTNTAHRGEKESVDMKAAMEGLLYKAGVDIVFAGHVHAYERFTRVYNDKADQCGPVHITIGDGGNREGLASRYDEPQVPISIFREASFGHGELDLVNATHALWTWHRNDENGSVAADSVWISSLASNPTCKQ